ncbi:MAG: DNA-formamidopyrimidine glycosylase [Candidatus Liptonbacteria bacterium]|nr:DNA-formamidopyrimidine glycosylase [Candidatus Liptonbacteria bacterium]
MPELPEVETIVRGLNKKVSGKKIINIWTDWPRHFSRHKGGFVSFRRQVSGATIQSVKRIGKNIIFELLDGKLMLIHLKMTGKLLLISRHRKSDGLAMSKKRSPYIHAIFYLSGNKLLAFLDVRKFGKILAASAPRLRKSAGPTKSKILGLDVGPDALLIKLVDFQKSLAGRKICIKKALLDQKILAGIGNIYADEILFLSRLHPLRSAKSLKKNEIKILHDSIKIILRKAIKLRGSSMSDYADVTGKPGNYYVLRLVYGREGEPCPRCETKIVRATLHGRPFHFCPKCQK